MLTLLKVWLTDPNVFLASILIVIAVGLCILVAFGIVGEIENHNKINKREVKEMMESRNNKSKIIVVFLVTAIVVSMAAVISTCVSTTEYMNREDTNIYEFDVQTVGTENISVSVSPVLLASNGDSATSKTLTATVSPSNATNKLVDWSVAWNNPSKTETVTDYVTVTPTYDGSTTATVTCLKAFGSEQITITVTTREGGYKATCVVTFRGVASSMYLTSNAVATSSADRGEYYNLPSKSSNTFTVNMSNVWDSVGSYNLQAEIEAQGSLYFYDGYSDSFGGSGRENIKLHSLSEYINALGITASVSGNVVTVRTDKVLGMDFYTSTYDDLDNAVFWYYNKVAWYEDWMSDYGSYTEEYKNAGAYNVEHIDSCYFVLKVTDTVSGLSSSVKFWVTTGVSSVSLSEDSIVF